MINANVDLRLLKEREAVFRVWLLLVGVFESRKEWQMTADDIVKISEKQFHRKLSRRNASMAIRRLEKLRLIETVKKAGTTVITMGGSK